MDTRCAVSRVTDAALTSSIAFAAHGWTRIEGRSQHEGPAATLAADPEIAALYLGGARTAAPA